MNSSKVVVSNIKNVNLGNVNLNPRSDDYEEEDYYDDYEDDAWSKQNNRKVLKFKEHKAK